MTDSRLSIISDLKKLELNPQINKKILQQFFERLENPKILRSQKNSDHFCVFFVPYDPQTKSVYLGHHIKADDWIPPGGHIEENESPEEAVIREMSEELSFKLFDEKIDLFDVTIKNIEKPRVDCKKHWDLWYRASVNKTDFTFDRGEFYSAKWVSLKEAKNLMQIKDYSRTLQKISYLSP